MSNEQLTSEERVKQIRERVSKRPSDEHAMNSACGEYNCPCHYEIEFLLSLLDSQAATSCKLGFEAKLLGFPNEDDRIKLCETCLLQAIADSFVVFSNGLPPQDQRPAITTRDYLFAELAHLNNPESDWPYGHRFQRQADGSSKCLCGFTLTPSNDAATRTRDLCVDAIKSLRAVPHGAAYDNAVNDAIAKVQSLTLDGEQK